MSGKSKHGKHPSHRQKARAKHFTAVAPQQVVPQGMVPPAKESATPAGVVAQPVRAPAPSVTSTAVQSYPFVAAELRKTSVLFAVVLVILFILAAFLS